MDMTKDRITEYLKHAMDLEISVYRQSQAVQNERKNASRRRSVTKKKVDLEPPKAPSETLEEPRKHIGILENELVRVGGVMVIVGVVAKFLTFIPGISVIAWVGWIIGGLCLAGGIIISVCDKGRYKKQYAAYMIEKEAAWKDYQRDYDRYKVEYDKLEARYEENYQEELAIVEKKQKIGLQVVDSMQNTFEETKQLLQRLYDVGVVYEKYRDMVAICTIYEYFASGRCQELEGPNGAYNLYESELRQNLIINRLETIVKKLDEIKAGQYMLYMQLKETNGILKDISSDVLKIVNATESIAQHTESIAYYSEISAKNTEAIKYLALVN